jgi:hypothetical protein
MMPSTRAFATASTRPNLLCFAPNLPMGNTSARSPPTEALEARFLCCAAYSTTQSNSVTATIPYSLASSMTSLIYETIEV